jgi:hypothetical protein
MREELESDRTLELDVLGPVDDTHPAPSELLEDTVLAGDERPCHSRPYGCLERFRQGRWRMAVRSEGCGAAAAKPRGVGVIGETFRTFQVPSPDPAGLSILN